MPLPTSLEDLEFQKFRDDTGTGIPIIRIANKDGTAISTGGGGGTSSTEGGSFTLGTSSGTPLLALFDDTPPAALTVNTTVRIPRVTANRALHANLRSAGGTELATSTAPLRIDPTGTTTQPVSGTVTANAGTGTFTVGGTVTANVGTTGGLALDATLTGGSAQAIIRGGAKGTTAAGTLTSNPVDANTQALHVTLAGTQASVPVTGTFWQATQPVSGTVTANAGTGFPTSLGQKTMANSFAVTVASDQTAVPVSGTFWQATQPVSGTVTANAGTGTFTVAGPTASGTAKSGNPVQAGGVFNTTQPTVTTGQLVEAQYTARGAAIVATGVDLFSASASQAGTWTVQPGNTQNTTAWLVTPAPAASGGVSTARIASAASTNATSVKASAGQVYGWYLYNNTASAKFLKLYNKASAPTVGTDTPFWTVSLPANGGTNIEYLMGVPMGTGVAYAITGGIADGDTTAVAANDVTGLLLYK